MYLKENDIADLFNANDYSELVKCGIHSSFYLDVLNSALNEPFDHINFSSEVLKSKRFVSKLVKAYKSQVRQINELKETKKLIAYSIIYWEFEELACLYIELARSLVFEHVELYIKGLVEKSIPEVLIEFENYEPQSKDISNKELFLDKMCEFIYGSETDTLNNIEGFAEQIKFYFERNPRSLFIRHSFMGVSPHTHQANDKND